MCLLAEGDARLGTAGRYSTPPAVYNDAALPAIRVGNVRRGAKNEQIASLPRPTCTRRWRSTVNVQGVTLGTTPKSIYA